MMRSLLIILLVVCTALPVGTLHAATCGSGQYVRDGVCINCMYNATCDGANYTCDAGFYDNGDYECVACPPNSICTSPTDFTCNPGSYLSGGACLACPVNATCAGGDETFHCNAGWYKWKGGTCKTCTDHICDGDTILRCGAGYYLHSSLGCINCNAWAWCPEGATDTICREGAYKGFGGVCTGCPKQYYCPFGTANMDNLTTYCAAGYYRAGLDCVKCADGIECPGGKPENMTCSSGLYLHSNGQCLPYAENDPGTPGHCNPGYYDGGTECLVCKEHSVCLSETDFDCVEGYYKDGTQCAVCPENANCNDTDGVLCKGGYYLSGGECMGCSTVDYCVNNVAIPCPAPTNQNVRGLSETDVVFNYFIYSNKAASVNECRIEYIQIRTDSYEYAEGNFFHDGEKYKLPSSRCYTTSPVGYYLATRSTVGGSGQIICYRDMYQCTNAPENAHYTGAGTPSGNDCPWACDTGFLRDGNVCTDCPAGKICRGGIVVTACPLGQFAVGERCTSCPTGYAARSPENIAPQSQNECQIECPGGTYLSTANGTECVSVGAGYWNGVNYTNYGSVGARNACPVGLTTTGDGVGADSAGDCGRVLHAGAHTLRLRSERRTTPSLCVRGADGVTLYGDMIAGSDRGHLRVKMGDVVYSVYNPDADR